MVNEENLNFDILGLDPRLEKSIKKIGWEKPTLIQEKAIIFGLEKKDLLIKGRTGCGKTGAFLIPILHNLLELKKNNILSGVRALILSPSKELCRQTSKICKELNFFSSKAISILDLTEKSKDKKILVMDTPDILISTPSNLIDNIKNEKIIDIKNTLLYLAIDEADLIFSFGYKEDMTQILNFLNKDSCQTFLISASLNTDIVSLKNLFLNNPVIIKLKENETNEKVIHYYIYLEEVDKFILLIGLFKFKLMNGRTIIFINNVNRCYKIKIFLELFGIKAILLNSEIPLTSRCHAIDQFNRGIYDIIIASDEKCITNPEKTKKSKFKKDKEFTVSRGIDFRNVNNIINFDFPDTQVSYIHRVGRTGRGPHEDVEGTVLSLISINEKKIFLECQNNLTEISSFKKFNFQINELESIVYRIKDAYKMITKRAINEARVKEIKKELLNSEKLKTYFQQNLKDFKALKQDKALHVVKPVPHLRNVPDYIIPNSLQSLVKSDVSNKRWYEEDKSDYHIQHNSIKKKRSSKKNVSNPLKTFKMYSKNK